MENLSKTIILNSKTLPSYTKIDTVLYLPYLKPLRRKLQKLHLVDKSYYEKKAAFTLQETLIALTILGVVAAITIPALINKYIEATKRTKVRKAMAAYEKALNNMVVENGIAGSIKAWADGVANCGNTNKYFKIINGGDCRFQTADKVCRVDFSLPLENKNM